MLVASPRRPRQYDDRAAGSGGFYKNAITSNLFLSLAARLAALAEQPAQAAEFARWAQRTWNFMRRGGMIASKTQGAASNSVGVAGLVSDGLCCWRVSEELRRCCADLECSQTVQGGCNPDRRAGRVCGDYCGAGDVCVNNNDTQ